MRILMTLTILSLSTAAFAADKPVPQQAPLGPVLDLPVRALDFGFGVARGAVCLPLSLLGGCAEPPPPPRARSKDKRSDRSNQSYRSVRHVYD